MFWKIWFKTKIYVVTYKYYGTHKKLITARNEIHALRKFHLFSILSLEDRELISIRRYESGEEL